LLDSGVDIRDRDHDVDGERATGVSHSPHDGTAGGTLRQRRRRRQPKQDCYRKMQTYRVPLPVHCRPALPDRTMSAQSGASLVVTWDFHFLILHRGAVYTRFIDFHYCPAKILVEGGRCLLSAIWG